ncbi:MAG TPA: DJ-1/PfpI family protein [bacterium]|nr:DJ-1/PfpI family protein [bacterium]HPN44587.1 DJ-1/PfpI family protein [bacterium]
MRIVILVFDGLTALDAVGPFEVLSKIPGAEIIFTALQKGLITCNGGLQLVASHSLQEIDVADILVIPGGTGTAALLENQPVLEWIRHIHQTTRFTASVCTGSLVLGAAGLLNGIPATTHWNHIPSLARYGAQPDKSRYVIADKIITAAGVSAGIDMALKLVALIRNENLAQIIQLAIEYDPAPPFDAGSPDKIPAPLLQAYNHAMKQKR